MKILVVCENRAQKILFKHFLSLLPDSKDVTLVTCGYSLAGLQFDEIFAFIPRTGDTYEIMEKWRYILEQVAIKVRPGAEIRIL